MIRLLSIPFFDMEDISFTIKKQMLSEIQTIEKITESFPMPKDESSHMTK